MSRRKQRTTSNSGPLRVLVTNDDGIGAPGLSALAHELSQLGEVVVVAPATERSGVGSGITWGHPIKFFPRPALFEGLEAYAVEGTPVDCIIVAFDLLMAQKPTLVVSGVNPGPNMGDSDIMLSGTLAAARHAAAYGLPAMAVSLGQMGADQFVTAARTARALVEGMCRWETGTILNVNVPDLPIEQVAGMALTRPYAQQNGSHVRAERRSGDGGDGWCELTVRSTGPGEEGTDDWAVKQGLVSVTPLGITRRSQGMDHLHARVADAYRIFREQRTTAGSV